MSSSEEQIMDEELSQQLTSTTNFQKELGGPTDKKKYLNPMALEKLRDAYNKVDSIISELTRFLWKRVEENERVNGLFKHKGGVFQG